MTNSVRTANAIRANVSELVERLYKTDKTAELVKEADIQLIVDELIRLSQNIVLYTVSDAVVLEDL